MTPIEDALRMINAAHESLFVQCLSNPITNVWGNQVDVSAVNDAHLKALQALAWLEKIPVAEPVAWLDDGTSGTNRYDKYRVVTTSSKEGMHASLAKSFFNPLYTKDALQAAYLAGRRDGAAGEEVPSWQAPS